MSLENRLNSDAALAEKTFTRLRENEKVGSFDWALVGWRYGRLDEALRIAKQRKSQGKLHMRESVAVQYAEKVLETNTTEDQERWDSIFPETLLGGMLYAITALSANGFHNGIMRALKREIRTAKITFSE